VQAKHLFMSVAMEFGESFDLVYFDYAASMEEIG
jgi:hypothetical protein